ncbi:hypothetical protein HD806DRAFT_520638 [Xylariaceae sp. AK1471]|nr:hypothetical protein HD806DRAFT_520638 [Xylariaceae sp. AK1471]
MSICKGGTNLKERPVDGLEGYFVVMAGLSASLCGGREHYTLFSKLKLELEIEQPDIRYNQPQIATTVDGMKKWLASTFIVSPASDAEDLYLSVKPIKQATLYYLPKSSELVFWGYHHTIDGIGILFFWHSYLEALSIPGIGPVSQLGAAPSGRCQNTELVFPAKNTNALVTACKDKGVSVTAAVYAAYIMAIVKHADPKSKLSQYVSANQFNLRQYLPEPYNSSKYAVAVYYSSLPYKFDLPDSPDLPRLKGNAEALELKGHFTQVLCGAVQTPEFLANPIPKDALVSSLGVAERYVQREYGNGIKVRDLRVDIDADQLRLVYSFNDGFEKAEDIQMYLEEVQAVLAQLLGEYSGAI